MSLAGPGLLVSWGTTVVIDRYAPEFKSRHPSVQRWWPRVLKYLGEDERGERSWFLFDGILHVHPNNASAVLKIEVKRPRAVYMDGV